MKKYLSSMLVMMCILLSAVVASAEKAEWKADNYNINKVQKIYVEDVVEKGDNVSFSELEDLKIRQSLDENEKYIKKYRIVNNKEIADAVLSVKMLSWGTNKRWVNEEKVTENQTITHTGKDGKTSSVTIPVTVTKPGYYYYTQYFSAKFVLTDKDGNIIFERIDKREDEKNAYDMFNRAVKDFYKDVNSLK
ncbi:hypothetical protein [uncultured Megamonas sp.]|uniref:hypothetical protein n=1 Tax=uncultured Megamonas sp. TaxID=286140 RepID=UPI00266F7A51|nr:hypothetical protein [uncultured Megamonas sp.]